MTDSLEIVLRPDQDQAVEWQRAAGDKPLEQWLSDLAQGAAISDAMSRERAREFPFTVKLKYPVTHGSKQITEITVRRGRVGDIKGITISRNGLGAEAWITVASRMTGELRETIEQLDVDDAFPIMGAAQDFLGRALGGEGR